MKFSFPHAIPLALHGGIVGLFVAVLVTPIMLDEDSSSVPSWVSIGGTVVLFDFVGGKLLRSRTR